MDQMMPGAEALPVKKGWSKWVKIGLGLVVLAGIIVAVGFWSTGGALAVADKQIALMKAGDIQGAYDLASKAFQAATSFSQFEDFISRATPLSQNKEYSFTSRNIQGDAATLSGTTVGQDGTVYKLEYRLVKEEGSWKVLGIDVNVQ